MISSSFLNLENILISLSDKISKDILNLDKTGYEIAALPTEYYALNTQEERDDYLKELHKDTSVLYVDKNDRPLESEAQRKEAEDYIVEQVKDGAQIGIKETPDLEPETSNELRLAMKALKDVGYQPSVEIARASLKKAGFSEEEVNSFTGEMIKDDKDDKKNTTKLIKLLLSHEWPYYFDQIVEQYPDAPITLVYRNNEASMDWWLEAGGFNITYPNYEFYCDTTGMWEQIEKQNKLILDFGQKHMLQWIQHHTYSDIFIATYRKQI